MRQPCLAIVVECGRVAAALLAKGGADVRLDSSLVIADTPDSAIGHRCRDPDHICSVLDA